MRSTLMFRAAMDAANLSGAHWEFVILQDADLTGAIIDVSSRTVSKGEPHGRVFVGDDLLSIEFLSGRLHQSRPFLYRVLQIRFERFA